jgi:hypothetical protein
MGAKYVSDKPDGYLKTRNNVYIDREHKQQQRTAQEQAQVRDIPPQTKANYGKKPSY